MINAGKLKKRLTIQYQSTTQDSYGADTVTWTELDTVWGKITPLLGREYFAAQQIHSEAKLKISIRYRTGIDTTMRVKYGNRYFYILEMQNVEERGEELLFLCKEVA